MLCDTDDSITYAQICANEARLREVIGRGYQIPVRFRTDEAANQALKGNVLADFSDTGSHALYEPLGRHTQRWRDAHFQVHRFCVFETLGIAYANTRDEDYARAARDYVEGWIDFIADNPDFIGAAGDINLACARRLLIWTGWLTDFDGSQAFTPEFVRKMVSSIAAQLDGLVAVCNTSSPNMRFTEAESLLVCGLRLKSHPHADTWIKNGARRINYAAHSQFLADGAHIELTPRYNMVYRFPACFLIQEAYPACGLQLNPQAFSARYDYWLANKRPNGEQNALNDSSGCNDSARTDGWDKDYRDFRKKTRLSPDYLPPTSQNFPLAGQAFWRSDWSEDAVYITFDASRRGSGHVHLGRNSLQLDAYGRSLLIDPGSFRYAYGDEWTCHGKATRTHNTVNLNGWNQYCSSAESRFASIPGYDLAEGHYTGGYWPGRFDWGFTGGQGRGLGGEHRRTVLWVRDSFLVILDRVFHGDRQADQALPFFESNWQFTCSCKVDIDNQRCSAVTRNKDSNLLMLFPLCSAEGGLKTVHPRLEIHSGETDPLRGWQVQNGEYVPAPQVSYVIPDVPYGVDTATVLIPYSGEQTPDIRVEAVEASASLGKLVLRTEDGSSHSLYWRPYNRHQCSLDEVDDYYTDGTLLYLRHNSEGAFVKGMALDATIVEPYGGVMSSEPGLHAF